MALRQSCGNSVVIPGDCVCHDDDVAEIVPSANLAGTVTVGVMSLADPVSVATADVAFREECVIMMTMFMMDIMTINWTILTMMIRLTLIVTQCVWCCWAR